jgi:DNA invertase Pin-like site-specific DNA recombinase
MEVKLGRLLGPYEEVDHKDGNPKNNKEYNFQILSTKENLKKQKLEGKCFLIPNRYGEQNSRSFLTNEDIIFIRKNNNIMSRKELATKFNIHKTTVGLIINRKRWNHI